MTPGDEAFVAIRVLRIDGDRVDGQTADGQLIQTDIANVVEKRAETPSRPIKQPNGNKAKKN